MMNKAFSPRKRFGQHFLCDQAIIHRIIAQLAPKATEHLIEIGPGQGALTIPILKLVNHLEVIELDRDLAQILRERAKHFEGLCIYSADVLKFDFSSVKKDQRLLRVFGNLPYNISTPLIFHLLTYSEMIADMLFMLQREVGKRLAAQKDSAEYGRLSVMVQYHCRVELLFDVPSSAFYPPPEVQSNVVRLIPYRQYPYPAIDYSLFASIVKQAFGQRRKTLRNSLKDRVTDAMWAAIPVCSDLRAENLSVKDFVAISNALSLFQRSLK
jgi:16S rRNA (adenine1518-N6/adenine1519-N6)-dimethyltransferase